MQLLDFQRFTNICFPQESLFAFVVVTLSNVFGADPTHAVLMLDKVLLSETGSLRFKSRINVVHSSVDTKVLVGIVG